MSEELMQKYEQIFYYQLNFMSSIDKMKFYSTQFNEIKPAIQKTIDFVDNYDCDWGDYKEKVLVNCIGVLPFILAKSFGNPELEDKKQIEEIITFLEFILKNKRNVLMMYLINSTTTDTSTELGINFDDSYGFDEEKLKKEISTFKKLKKLKNSVKQKWFSNVHQILFLPKTLRYVYGTKEKQIAQFMYDLFMEFDKEVDLDVIKKKLIHKSNKDDLIKLNAFENVYVHN